MLTPRGARQDLACGVPRRPSSYPLSPPAAAPAGGARLRSLAAMAVVSGRRTSRDSPWWCTPRLPCVPMSAPAGSPSSVQPLAYAPPARQRRAAPRPASIAHRAVPVRCRVMEHAIRRGRGPPRHQPADLAILLSSARMILFDATIPTWVYSSRNSRQTATTYGVICFNRWRGHVGNK